MRKLLKKSLSCILALTLIASALPMFAIASDNGAERKKFNAIDSSSVRSKNDPQGKKVFVYNSTGDNHRVAFLKFDLTGITSEQIRTIGSASLSIFARKGSGAYQGLKASILPAKCEDWSSSTLLYKDAKEKGMLSSDIPVISTDETNIDTDIEEYKIITGLGNAIAEHLMTDVKNKIVCIRLEAINTTNPTFFGNDEYTYPPYLSLTFDGTYRLLKATIYDGSSTRGTKTTNQQIMGRTIYTQANSSNNTRYAFYKFDFSNFSITDLCRVKDMTLNLYYTGTKPYTGVNVAVLPGEMEDWTSETGKTNTLTSTYAYQKGMVDVSTIASNTDDLGSSTIGWKPVTGLGNAIVQHLLSDADNKIVAIRVDAYSGTDPCSYSGLDQDASIQPYISATSIEEAVSDSSIIIGGETINGTVLTAVKFATTVPVADTNIQLIAASYNANELVAISVADVTSVSEDWNTASLNLSLAQSTKIKYMLWSDTTNSITPITSSVEKSITLNNE